MRRIREGAGHRLGVRTVMDFAAARRNMVESQLRPNRVTDGRLLAAMGEIPRELFVPTAHRSLAYVDEDLRIGDGRHLMEPAVLGRLLQAAECRSDDMALVVGCGTGYTAALLARLVATVFALESNHGVAADATNRLSELGLDNVVAVEGPLPAGWPAQQPYDLILVDGGMEEIPAALTKQLAPEGRLLTVVMSGPQGKAQIIRRFGNQVSHRVLFDAAVPVLPEFRKAAGFVF